MGAVCPCCGLRLFAAALRPRLRRSLSLCRPVLFTGPSHALYSPSLHSPCSPLRVLGEKLLEKAESLSREQRAVEHAGPAGPEVLRSGSVDEDEEVERRARQRGKGRRAVVFAEPVALSSDWTPVVVPKSPEQQEEIDAVLRSNLLFAGMDADQRRVLVDAMTPKSFEAGAVIIRQGDPGDYYYVLSEGTVDISVNGKLVFSARKGMGFGELALMYDAPRAATVTASSSVQAWALDRATFKQVLIGTTIKKRQLYESFLSRVPLLSALTKEEILVIADALQPVSFEAGDIVVAEGDPNADRFFIVERGELMATIGGVEGEVCPRLGPGSYFGERAMIKDEPRAATVTACTPSRCLAMDRASFLRLLGPISAILRRNLDLYTQYGAGLVSPKPTGMPSGGSTGGGAGFE